MTQIDAGSAANMVGGAVPYSAVEWAWTIAQETLTKPFRLAVMPAIDWSCRVRSHVTRRKVSGGTRSDLGRDCRDAFLALAKTCTKLEIAFWDYLGARLAVAGSQSIQPLPEIILARARSP